MLQLNGGGAMNLVWANWEPSPVAPPCDASTQEEYEGRCFTVDGAVDQAIAAWTQLGLVVTGVVYGVPAWARQGKVCSPVSPRRTRCVAEDLTRRERPSSATVAQSA